MRTVGYSILALILFYLFLLVQFPYGAIKENLARNFAQLNMGKLDIGKVSPSFPFDLRLQNISWNLENLGIQIPDLIMGINVYKTILGNTDIDIKDLKNPQRLRGKYYYKIKEGNFQIRLENTRLKVTYKNDYSLPISLSGEVKLHWVAEDYEKVNGEFWILLQRGEIETKSGGRVPFFLSIYDRLKAEVQIKNGTFEVKRLVISGKESKEIVLRDLNLTDFLRSQSPDLSRIFIPPLKGPSP